MIENRTIAVLRFEAVRAARDPWRGLRFATAIAVPVAVAIVIAWSRAEVGSDPTDSILGLSFDRFVVATVLGFVLLQVALVATAAALVEATRRRRDFAVYSANGATRESLVIAGASLASITGAIGAAFGVVVGLAIVAAFSRFGVVTRVTVESLREGAGFILGCLAIAVAMSAIAGIVPAWSATRGRLRDSLIRADRAPEAAGGRFARVVTLLCLGAPMVAFLDAPRMVIAVASILGAIACFAVIPIVLDQLPRAAASLPLPWRLACRDAARMRERFAPGVVATAFALATALTVAFLFTAVESKAREGLDSGVFESDRRALAVIVGLCASAAIATTLLSSSLAAAESQADARALVLVGASDDLVSRCGAASGAVLALCATLCALPAGAFAATAWLAVANVPLAFPMPSAGIVVSTLVVPLVVYFVKLLLFAPRPPPLR